MNNHRTEHYDDQTSAPFGAARAEVYFYGPDGRPADEAAAHRVTVTYYDADGQWCGCGQGFTDLGLARPSEPPQRTG